MLNPRFLEFQYKLSKGELLRRPSRLFSAQNRQNSRLLPVFLPDAAEMKRVFEKIDSNKDGKISQEEYKAILRAIGKESTAVGVSKLFQAADLNGDGYIDFEEFMKLHYEGGGIRTMDIHNAFRAFDLDNDGKISAEEVLQMLRRLGETCTLEDCTRMVRAADVDGDGTIDVDEFMSMMTRNMNSISVD